MKSLVDSNTVLLKQPCVYKITITIKRKVMCNNHLAGNTLQEGYLQICFESLELLSQSGKIRDFAKFLLQRHREKTKIN